VRRAGREGQVECLCDVLGGNAVEARFLAVHAEEQFPLISLDSVVHIHDARLLFHAAFTT